MQTGREEKGDKQAGREHCTRGKQAGRGKKEEVSTRNLTINISAGTCYYFVSSKTSASELSTIPRWFWYSEQLCFHPCNRSPELSVPVLLGIKRFPHCNNYRQTFRKVFK